MNNLSQRGTTFVGILIGLVLGLAIALGVAWYINKLPNPFRDRPPVPSAPKFDPVPLKPAPPEETKDGGKESAPGKSDAVEKDKPKDAPAKNEKADKADKGDAGAEKKAGKETYFIQTGSFQNQADADNLKARLALLGLEAAVQTRSLPDKGVWYRVRLGPYSNVDELNTIRGALTQNNIDTVMVRVREADK